MNDWMTEHQLIMALVLGVYAFAGGAYGWAWLLYTRLTQMVDRLQTNHLKHVEARLQALEHCTGIEPPVDTRP